MFGLGLPELLIILVIVLILFGAAKLPQIGSGLGQAIRDFKKGIREEKLKDITKQEKTGPKGERES
jgi:sec-independent protein translocase protein TatA